MRNPWPMVDVRLEVKLRACIECNIVEGILVSSSFFHQVRPCGTPLRRGLQVPTKAHLCRYPTRFCCTPTSMAPGFRNSLIVNA